MSACARARHGAVSDENTAEDVLEDYEEQRGLLFETTTDSSRPSEFSRASCRGKLQNLRGGQPPRWSTPTTATTTPTSAGWLPRRPRQDAPTNSSHDGEGRPSPHVLELRGRVPQRRDERLGRSGGPTAGLGLRRGRQMVRARHRRDGRAVRGRVRAERAARRGDARAARRPRRHRHVPPCRLA